MEIDHKVASNAKDQRRSRSVFPTWGDIYRLSDLSSAHAAAPLNPQYSRLLNKSIPSSRCLLILGGLRSFGVVSMGFSWFSVVRVVGHGFPVCILA